MRGHHDEIRAILASILNDLLCDIWSDPKNSFHIQMRERGAQKITQPLFRRDFSLEIPVGVGFQRRLNMQQSDLRVKAFR